MTGIIIGTGVDEASLLPGAVCERVMTRWGPAELLSGSLDGAEVVLVRRHGAGHRIPPHRINYRANIAALKARGVRRVLATAAVGSLNPRMAPGHFCVPDDLIDWTRTRPFTFFDGKDGRVVHTDMTHPYCEGVRSALLGAAEANGLVVHPRGCYACLEGPRYETPAEIRALRTLGADIVGMTNGTEAILCREAGLCLATLALVTNWAAGLGPDRLDHADVTEEVGRNREKMIHTLRLAVRILHQGDVRCACSAPEDEIRSR